MPTDQRRPATDPDPLQEDDGQPISGRHRFALSLAAALIIGTLAVFALAPSPMPDPVGTTPEVDVVATDRTTPPMDEPDSPLRIAPDDITYMNRIFHERTHEIGYCGVIEEGKLKPWLADTIQSDQTSVDYVTDNCPDDARAILHTHLNGNTMLSKTDAHELTTGPYDVMCIQAGQITPRPGDRTKNLRCYQHVQTNEGDTIYELPVRVPHPVT